MPTLGWPLFDNNTAYANAGIMQAMEGIYNVESGKEIFGDQAVLKWSYKIENGDTINYLSAFFNKEVAYFIVEGKKSGDSLIMKGYWRKNINTETGQIRLVQMNEATVLEGVSGNDNGIPQLPLSLKFLRPLAANDSFQVLAHRGGGRNSDLLPASENSIRMIKMASQFGATGIEIDVRLTSDGVHVIYHDESLNERSTKKSGLVGHINNYSYNQLSTLIELPDGQKIPTLREALDAVVYQTPLKFVWLDTKFEGTMDEIKAIREEYIQKAAATGRNLEIMIGVPTKDVKQMFEKLHGYENIPAVCELEIEDVRKLNAKAWAPRWTLGLQQNEVDQMHAENRKVYVWTIDVPDYVRIFIENGKFDGILTNYPSLVAYYHYVNEK